MTNLQEVHDDPAKKAESVERMMRLHSATVEKGRNPADSADLRAALERMADDAPLPDEAISATDSARVLDQEDIDNLLGFTPPPPPPPADPTAPLRAMIRLLLDDPRNDDLRTVAAALIGGAP